MSRLACARLRGQVLLLAALNASAATVSAATPADTQISNTAPVQYVMNGQTSTTSSNMATLDVDQLVDVVVVNDDGTGVSVSSPDTNRPLSFTVTNTGNGSQGYRLTANSTLSGDQFDPVLVSIYLDDGDGVFDPSKDTLYVPGTNDPNLKAGASIKVFAINNIPAGRVSGDKGFGQLTATALTGLGTPNQGKPGASYPGLGTGGTTAVLGPNGGTSTAQGTYIVVPLSTVLQKSLLSVLDPQAGSVSEPGSVLTYQLKLSVNAPSGTGGTYVATGVVIADPIPTYTTYVPNSLQLDGVALTDIQDADAGRFTGTGIEVDLGNVTAPATRTVIFKVTIN